MGTVPGWRLLTVASMLALTIPRLWQRGMFLDGVTYAAIARNMAEGVGSFWAPSFSATTYPQFFEQPPLGLGLQALVFVLAGDHPAVERTYAVAVFLLNGLCIAALARRLLPPALDWVPVLLWLTPPVVTWVVVNNMLENTLSLFTSAGCLAMLRTAGRRAPAVDAAWAAIAGTCVVAASLTKGPVGLFPLILPVLVPILPPRHRPARPLLVFATVAAVVLAAAFCLAACAPSRAALEAFVRTHLVSTLTGARGVGPAGTGILRHLLLGIGLRLAAVVALVWLARRRVRVEHRRAALFFLSLGTAASLPILVSPLLAGHYFFPSTVFFALGAAAMIVPSAIAEPSAAAVRLPWLPHALAAALAIAVGGTLAVHGPIEPRDVARVDSLRILEPMLPGRTTAGVCAAAAGDWGLHGYLQRFGRVSLDPDPEARHTWFLQEKRTCAPPPGCRVVADAPALAWLRCDGA